MCVLCHLPQDAVVASFENVAVLLATTIVVEIGLPRRLKTLKPLPQPRDPRSPRRASPTAAESKASAAASVRVETRQPLLFNAAGLYALAIADPNGRLGGYDRAAKVIGHERRGTQAYMDEPATDSVAFPLSVTVDFCGYRVHVVAHMPVTESDTLV